MNETSAFARSVLPSELATDIPFFAPGGTLCHLPPTLATQNELAACEPHGERYQLLAAAAKINEPRVREALALLTAAQQALAEDSPLLAAEEVRAAHFAIAALLPPANIRISARLASLISQSGRKKDA